MAKLKEVVVTDAIRSPIGRSGRKGMEKGGQLCQASAREMISEERGHTRELLDRAGAINMKKAVEAQRKRRV